MILDLAEETKYDMSTVTAKPRSTGFFFDFLVDIFQE